LTGEPGIGKSRLAEHLAAMATAEGSTVVWGRCWEAGGAPAYWPWIQIFRGLEMEEDPFAAGMHDVGVVAEQARFQAFDLSVRRLKQRASLSPLVLVLDDLHAADVPSLLLLLMLVRDLRGSRILVVGAYRDAEARLAPEIAALLAKIEREGDVLALSRLGPEDVAAWMREASPSASAEQADGLYRVTEGHPLFVTEVLRLGCAEAARTRILYGLGTVLDERLSLLSARTLTVLEVAAVLGREFSAVDVAATGGLTVDEVHERVREAYAAHIVTVADDPDRFLFSHVLLRDRLYADLTPSRKAALHWTAGTVKLARGEDAATAVDHLFEGHTAGDADRTAEVAIKAVEAALVRFAFEDAARLAQRALSLVERGVAPSRLQCQLRLMLAEAWIRMGEGAKGKEASTEAAELAKQIGAEDLLARAALVYGTDLLAGFVDEKMVSLLREALARLDPRDSPIRARVMVRLAAALVPPRTENVPEILALVREATAVARRLGDPYTLLYVLQFAALGGAYNFHEEKRFALLQEAVTLARVLDQRLVLLNASGWYIAGLLERGQRAEAEAALKVYEDLLAEFPQPHYQWRFPLTSALFYALKGDFDEADLLSEEARTLADRAGSRAGMLAWAQQRVSFAYLRGRPDLIAKAAAQLRELLERTPAIMVFDVWILAATGRCEEAAKRLRSVDVAPCNFPSLFIACDACVMLGETEMAATLYPHLAATATSNRVFWGTSGSSVLGPTSRTLGNLALLLGRVEDALRHYDEAIAFCERMGAHPLAELSRRSREAALASRFDAPKSRPATLAAVSTPEVVRVRFDLRREGEVWAIEGSTGPGFLLKHSKGITYLHDLIKQPGREVHVFDLVGIEHVAGDAGPLLDARAKAAYRTRLEDIQEEIVRRQLLWQSDDNYFGSPAPGGRTRTATSRGA
jgi:tetratricopeptide (TPR) repeat protein